MRFKAMLFTVLTALFIAPAFAENVDPIKPLILPQAQNSDSPLKVGLIGGFQMPVGTAKTDAFVGTDSSDGYNYGIMASVDLSQHHQLRAILMKSVFPGQTKTQTVLPLEISLGDTPLAITADHSNHYTATSIGMDYIYNFDTSNHGFYMGGGASLVNLRNEYTNTFGVNGYNLVNQKGSVSENCLGLKAVLGYNVNEHVALEGTYNYIATNENTFGIDNFSSVGVNLVLRF
jgi:opacity protein-like surface antigen